MPELPEIASRAAQMTELLAGKVIQEITVLQPKCLNIPAAEFQASLCGAKLGKTTCRGKWLFTETDLGRLLLNLGMGGELLLVKPDRLPEKRRLVFHFTDGEALSVNFWWFGYAHFTRPDELHRHEMTARLGPNALDVSMEDLAAAAKTQRTRVKSYLLDQSKIAGIGNAYIHDILFLARLHPLTQLITLTPDQISGLHAAIRKGLTTSLEKGGAFYEVDLLGRPGGFTMDDILIGYKEGKPCPVCSTPITKIKTGATSSYICPHCQPL